MESTEKVKSRWTRSFFTDQHTRHDEERYICDICNIEFTSPSNLSLHKSTHVIERPHKCEPCQVSFHTKGHLEKHRRSSAHETRVKMTQAFGVPSPDNPRPYNCPECDIAFRKHGHLAKHLRSKSHIMKMETNGSVPPGTWAVFDKSPTEVKERLVCTNCESSLESLRLIATTVLNLSTDVNTRQQQHQQKQQQQQDKPPSPLALTTSTAHHLVATSATSATTINNVAAHLHLNHQNHHHNQQPQHHPQHPKSLNSAVFTATNLMVASPISNSASNPTTSPSPPIDVSNDYEDEAQDYCLNHNRN